MIRFGIIRFGSVNDTEASVFGYSVSTRFDRPLVEFGVGIESEFVVFIFRYVVKFFSLKIPKSLAFIMI